MVRKLKLPKNKENELFKRFFPSYFLFFCCSEFQHLPRHNGRHFPLELLKSQQSRDLKSIPTAAGTNTTNRRTPTGTDINESRRRKKKGEERRTEGRRHNSRGKVAKSRENRKTLTIDKNGVGLDLSRDYARFFSLPQGETVTRFPRFYKP